MATARRRAYQLRVALSGARPPIWRRFLVSPTVALSELHEVLQVVMGWEDCHLHHFRRVKRYYAPPNPWDDGFGPASVDSRKVRLGQLLRKPKDWIAYQYDFGDSWRHRVTLQKILPVDPAIRLPACIAGKRSCPPEDCGGLWGYYEMLAALADPAHEEHEDMVDWIGRFDPDEFNVDDVNAQLRARWK
ncbi:plasmid pRiA4b ORF-3 family protein [Candidatus Palauibacter sp.]|uniref:plasmid pRiA4b ORF-3 family protein n=1 Tax=Candidatus Palauibacter sp. TaxID=3101350 RepID=UPI003B5AD81C